MRILFVACIRNGYPRRKLGHSKSGMILVIMLAMIVLVTIAVMAFFIHATADRQSESARTRKTLSSLLAHSGTDHAIGELIGEMKSNSTPTNGIYLPNHATNFLPARKLSTNLSLTNVNFFSLIRQSTPGADARASAASSAAVSRSGRSLTADLWNAPKLLGGAGFQGDNQLPHWIYVTRTGGLTNAAGGDVVGRFSYNVYDTGGLLDVNIAGYDPGVFAAKSVASLKSTQAGADLSQLGLSTNAIKNLLQFRNSDTTESEAQYRQRVGAFQRAGFLAAVVNEGGQKFTNNSFTSRQDLLRYARTQNGSLANALPYLTHYSRRINSPAWKPPVVTPANPVLFEIRHKVGGWIKHYEDDGSSHDILVAPEDMLVQRKFSLAKLAWLTPTGPKAGISEAAIQTCFGLRWDENDERWNYVGPTGDVTQSEIKILAEIAEENSPREANFFEFLKAGIASGSLGAAAIAVSVNKEPASACGSTSIELDRNKDLHILKIGANIIDGADSDNYPTILALNFGPSIERAGVEDLPYFFTVDTAHLRAMTYETANSKMTVTLTQSEFAWVPELLNPHRRSSPTSGPAGLKIEILNGGLDAVGFNDNGWANNLKLSPPNFFRDLSSLPSIDLPAENNGFESYRNAPAPVRQSGASNSLGAFSPISPAAEQDVLAFRLFSHAVDYPTGLPAVITDAQSDMPVIRVTGVILALRYQTPKGNWKTYVTMGGDEALPTDTGISGMYFDDFEFYVFKQASNFNDIKSIAAIYSPYLAPWDPRSSRFGPIFGRYRRTLAQLPQFTVTTGNFAASPKPFAPTSYFNYPDAAKKNPRTGFLGNLPQMPGFQDPDFDASVGTRPPDGGIGFIMPGTTATAANPYKNLTDMDPRPVILQRPYQTVAELGYVSRDTPWQTLDFYNDRSGDAALLDFFAVADEPVVSSGSVNLNTPHGPVRQALLSGSGQVYDGTLPLDGATTDKVSAAMSLRAFSGGQPATNAFTNPGDVPKFLSSNEISGASLSPIKYRREAVTRALSATQTRTWNLLIDVVAQTGRFAWNTATPEDFLIEGECRAWTSLAIDRFTAGIVDRSQEIYRE